MLAKGAKQGSGRTGSAGRAQARQAVPHRKTQKTVKSPEQITVQAAVADSRIWTALRVQTAVADRRISFPMDIRSRLPSRVRQGC